MIQQYHCFLICLDVEAKFFSTFAHYSKKDDFFETKVDQNRNYISTPTDWSKFFLSSSWPYAIHHCLFLCDYFMLLSAFALQNSVSSIAIIAKSKQFLALIQTFLHGSSCNTRFLKGQLAKNRLEIWYCSFFVYTILNFQRFFSTESGPSKVREIQNSVNKKCTISEF